MLAFAHNMEVTLVLQENVPQHKDTSVVLNAPAKKSTEMFATRARNSIATRNVNLNTSKENFDLPE